MMPRRTASPRAATDGGTGTEKRFVDYNMEAAPSPGTLIGKRIIDALREQAGSPTGPHVRG